MGKKDNKQSQKGGPRPGRNIGGRGAPRAEQMNRPARGDRDGRMTPYRNTWSEDIDVVADPALAIERCLEHMQSIRKRSENLEKALRKELKDAVAIGRRGLELLISRDLLLTAENLRLKGEFKALADQFRVLEMKVKAFGKARDSRQSKYDTTPERPRLSERRNYSPSPGVQASPGLVKNVLAMVEEVMSGKLRTSPSSAIPGPSRESPVPGRNKKRSRRRKKKAKAASEEAVGSCPEASTSTAKCSQSSPITRPKEDSNLERAERTPKPSAAFSLSDPSVIDAWFRGTNSGGANRRTSQDADEISNLLIERLNQLVGVENPRSDRAVNHTSGIFSRATREVTDQPAEAQEYTSANGSRKRRNRKRRGLKSAIIAV